MTAENLIKLKQKAWAERKKFTLLPGTIANKNGDKIYLDDYNKNLYESLSENNEKSYNEGSGGETKDTKTRRAPMKAAFSSSAIVVNLFQYWQGKDVSPLLKALNMIGHNDKIINALIKFEDKKKITNKKTKEEISEPHLDVTIESESLQHAIAIESKFTEPYSHKTQKELAEKYNNDELWKGLEEIKEEIDILEKEKREKIFRFKRLDYLQLTKHILGLKTQHGKKFKLLYLWYDVPCKEGCEHRKEIEDFKKIVEKDSINFRSITYQEVIYYLRENYYNEHNEYIDYLVERYL